MYREFQENRGRKVFKVLKGSREFPVFKGRAAHKANVVQLARKAPLVLLESQDRKVIQALQEQQGHKGPPDRKESKEMSAQLGQPVQKAKLD